MIVRALLVVSLGCVGAAALFRLWPLDPVMAVRPAETAEVMIDENDRSPGAEFAERSLFSSVIEQSEIAPEPTAPLAQQTPPPRLVGIAMDSEGPLAWFELEPGRTIRVRTGEDVGAWTVLEIRPSSIHLGAADREVRLEIYQ
ncbi:MULTISPECIES: hypothetical protein [Hyphobacterium]|uniref:Type II secretion system protein GspC N-terminal domain-containing protein n=1 Tax=Hyphobacterium vulgare TaxID=1736751 RepID=A0ABV6ZX27_9PROT